jgi:hypothetical protein
MTWIVSPRYPMAGGLILASPRFLVEDWAGAHGAAALLGDDFTPDQGTGDVFQRRYLGPIRFAFPLKIFGDVDVDGNPVTPADVGLRTAVEAAKTAITTTTATKEFRDVYSDGSYMAGQAVMSVGPFRAIDMYAVQTVVDVKVVGGVWTLTAAP